MSDEIFRKSSVDRLNAPEQLNEYIRVAQPSVWLVLAAIVLLLAGVLVWGVFGLIQTKLDCGALVENGIAVCYLNAQDAAKARPGDPVSVADLDGTLKNVAAAPTRAKDEDAYLLRLSDLVAGAPCYLAEVEMDTTGLEDGVYPATLTVESLHPITFVTR